MWRERLSQARASFEAEQRGLLAGRELAIARSYLQTRELEIEAADRAFVCDSTVAQNKRLADEAEEGTLPPSGRRRRSRRGASETLSRLPRSRRRRLQRKGVPEMLLRKQPARQQRVPRRKSTFVRKRRLQLENYVNRLLVW